MNLQRVSSKAATVLLSLAAMAPAAAATLQVPSGYPTIQAAINAAAPGDTISIAPGTYSGNVNLNKRLILQGSGSGSNPLSATILASSTALQPVISITAGGLDANTRTVVRNLRVRGAVGDGNPGSGIRYSAFGFTTFQNVAAVNNAGNGIAIDLGGGTVTDVVVDGCNLSDNGGAGFRVPTSPVVDGLRITGSQLNANRGGGLTGFGLGMLNWEILNSTFNDNVEPTGLSFTGGYGISLHGFPGAAQTVANVRIDGCQFNRNRGTHPTNNISSGIQLVVREGDSFSNININNCRFQGNALRGLSIEHRASGTLSGLTVTCSTFEGNTQAGILAFDTGSPSNVAINENSIVGNGAGFINQTAVTLNAEQNWWGSATGPRHASNPNGTGNPVSDRVDFTPWRTTLPLCGPAPVDSDGDGIPDSQDPAPISDTRPRVDVGTGATSIVNRTVTPGVTIQDQVNRCRATSANFSQYVACIHQLAQDLAAAGLITSRQKQEMIVEASRAGRSFSTAR